MSFDQNGRDFACYDPCKCSLFVLFSHRTWDLERFAYSIQPVFVQTGTATREQGHDLPKVMKGKLPGDQGDGRQSAIGLSQRSTSWDKPCLGIPERPKTQLEWRNNKKGTGEINKRDQGKYGQGQIRVTSIVTTELHCQANAAFSQIAFSMRA